MRESTRMMMMRTGQIMELRAVEYAVLAIAMNTTMARVRRTCRVVRKGLGKGREQRIGRGNRRGLRTQRDKGTARGTEKGMVLLNKPQVAKALRAVERLQGPRPIGH